MKRIVWGIFLVLLLMPSVMAFGGWNKNQWDDFFWTVFPWEDLRLYLPIIFHGGTWTFSNLNVTGTATINNLTVINQTVFNINNTGNMSVGGNLNVGGNAIITGSLGTTTERVLKGWFTDLTSTNAMVGGLIPLSASSGTLIKNFNGDIVASFGLGGADSLNTGLLGNVVVSGTLGVGATTVTSLDAGSGTITTTGTNKGGTLNATDALNVPVDSSCTARGCTYYNSTEDELEFYGLNGRTPTGSQKYLYIKANNKNEGNINISNSTTWGVSKSIISTIRVITASTDWDLYLLQNDNGHTANDAEIPESMLGYREYGNNTIYLNMPYEDEDASGEVHLFWNDDSSAAGKATIIVQGVKVR